MKQTVFLFLYFLCTAHAFRPTLLASRPNLALDASRRDVLASSLLTAIITLCPSISRAVDYKDVAKDIEALVRDDPNKGPTLVRLAWHSSGTYDKVSKTGGSGQGTIRFSEELAHGGNAGLKDTAVQWLEPIHAKYDGLVSYADLYTLAGGECLRTVLVHPSCLLTHYHLLQSLRFMPWAVRSFHGVVDVSMPLIHLL